MMNGLLHGYSSSSVNSPSQLITFWPGLGTTAAEGFVGSQPILWCDDVTQPCRYVPTKADCSSARNGEWSNGFLVPEGQTMYAHPGGVNVAFADSSAKFRRVGSNVKGKTDFRTDPYSGYTAAGVPEKFWWDDQFCHMLLFRPDNDFSNLGSPIEY
jgi:prepilin-type processing-associated H-X9-DG protein